MQPVRIETEMRTVERLENGEWNKIEFASLKEGDTFRMFEPTGEPVVETLSEGNTSSQWTATSDAFFSDIQRQLVVTVD